MFSVPLLSQTINIRPIPDIVNSIQKYPKPPKEGINARQPSVTDYGLRFLLNFNDGMSELLDRAKSYNIVDEYNMLLKDYRANFVDLVSGKSYYAVGSEQINPQMKLVSIINDQVYSEILKQRPGENKFNYNIKLVYKTKNNKYYNFAYAINNICSLICVLGGALKKKLQRENINKDETLISCIEKAFGQCLIDVHRNAIEINIGSEKLMLLTEEADTPEKQTKYFNETYIPTMQRVKELCSAKIPDNLIISKIKLCICIALTQTFDALDLDIMQPIGLDLKNIDSEIIRLFIDIDNHCVYWSKIFNSRHQVGNTYITNSKSYIIYKCYDYESDMIYTNVDILVPVIETLKTKVTPENREELQEVFARGTFELDTSRHARKPVQYTKPLILPPMQINKNETEVISTLTTETGVDVQLNLQFLSSGGILNIYDYIFKNQLFDSRYLDSLSKIAGKQITSVIELFMSASSFDDVIGNITSMFFSNKPENNIQIINIEYTNSPGTTDMKPVPIFIMIYKLYNSKKRECFHTISYVSPESLHETGLQINYARFIDKYLAMTAKMVNSYNISQKQVKHFFMPTKITIPFDRVQMKCNKKIVNDMDLSSLITLYGVINGIVVMVDRKIQEELLVNNFDIFLYELISSMLPYTIIEDKHGIVVNAARQLSRVSSRGSARSKGSKGSTNSSSSFVKIPTIPSRRGSMRQSGGLKKTHKKRRLVGKSKLMS